MTIEMGYTITAWLVLTGLACATLSFGYLGWTTYRRPVASMFAWLCCTLYFGVTALAAMLMFG